MTDVSRVYTAFRRFDVDESNHLDDQELSCRDRVRKDGEWMEVIKYKGGCHWVAE